MTNLRTGSVLALATAFLTWNMVQAEAQEPQRYDRGNFGSGGGSIMAEKPFSGNAFHEEAQAEAEADSGRRLGDTLRVLEERRRPDPVTREDLEQRYDGTHSNPRFLPPCSSAPSGAPCRSF